MKPYIFSWVSPYLIREGKEIFRDSDRHSIETVTQSKNMLLNMNQCENDGRISQHVQDGGIKFDRVISIRVAKPLILFNILRAVVH